MYSAVHNIHNKDILKSTQLSKPSGQLPRAVFLGLLQIVYDFFLQSEDYLVWPVCLEQFQGQQVATMETQKKSGVSLHFFRHHYFSGGFWFSIFQIIVLLNSNLIMQVFKPKQCTIVPQKNEVCIT